jgi:membrane protein DedA with SNARE-associated domain
MTAKILTALSAFIIAVISSGGYLGIVLLMAIESACIPLPSEVIMPFSGALTVPAIAAVYHHAPLRLLWVATAGALGCNLGSAVAYAVGYFGGPPLVRRFGRLVWLTEHELELSRHFFARYGGVTVFVARLLPVVRTFIALPAGVARMPQLRFHVYTFLGSWPWCFALAYLGMKAGEHWDYLRLYFHRFDAAIAALLLLAFAWFVRVRWKGRVRAEAGLSNAR